MRSSSSQNLGPASGRPVPKLTTEFARRFWAKVDKTENCWNWTASLTRAGYGQFSAFGDVWAAHRISYSECIGDIPDGLTIDHLCKNKCCVNPTHLEVVTAEENLRRVQRVPKSHCKNGHPFDEANTYIRPDDGARQCRTCRQAAGRRYYARSVATITLIVAATLFTTETASAATSRQDKLATATVAYVAAHTVEGWADTGTLTEDEAMMAAGTRIRVGCSNQAILAARALIRRGIPARLIQGASLDPAAPSGDYGHSVVEAFVDGRWQVYDITYNVKPVLPDGAGMTVERYASRLAANQPVRFVRLANDDGVDWTDYPTQLADIGHTRAEIALGVYGFDRLRLQQVFIWTAAHGFVFQANPRVGAYVTGRWPTFYHWLGATAYAKLTAGAAAYDRGILTW